MKTKENNSTTVIISVSIISVLIVIIIGLIGYIIYVKNLKTENDNQPPKLEEGNNKTETDKKEHQAGNLYKNSTDQEVICHTTSKSPYKKGTEYICDNLGDNKSYTFYVLTDASNSDKVNLIMDRDYAISSYSELTPEGQIDLEGENNPSYGPVKAIKTLPTLKEWSNLESPKDDSGYDYSQYAARLPMAIEIAQACEIPNYNPELHRTFELKSKDECRYLWSNTKHIDNTIEQDGYLTSTQIELASQSWIIMSTDLNQEEQDKRIYVYNGPSLKNTVLLIPAYTGANFGVRPVISLSK